jgi:hypothetical protein
MIQTDKKMHLFAGAAIAATVALYADPLTGLAAGVFAGAAKEIADRMGYGTPSWSDFWWTVAGAAVVLPALLPSEWALGVIAAVQGAM